MKSFSRSFREEIFKITARIKKGQVATYKEIATSAGRSGAARAVGNILNQNKNPKVPCHRVVRSNGKVGGYNGGTALKKRKLAAEGVKLTAGRLKIRIRRVN